MKIFTFNLKFYEYSISFIYRSFIKKKKKLQQPFSQKKKYLSYLQSHFPDVYNPQYKTYKLTDKLMKAFGNHIQFRQPNYKSELVFSKDVPKGAAIETAFEQASSEEKRLEEAALILRQEVFAVYMQICHLYHGHIAQRISFQSKEALLHFS